MTKLPTFSQFKQIFKVLNEGEKIIFLTCSLLAVGSLTFLTANFYFNNTIVAPDDGGIYKEGIVGQPRFINPIYGETNDIDRTLIGLVFSGLMTYDNRGKIIEDLVEKYKISDDGKIYEFNLRENIFWHDGKPITADDVIFTIKTIQSSDYKSPLKANWIDIETEKISSKTLRLILKSPYNSFLENCTLKIIPKHIWQEITPENFILSSYNLQPIGSGPYEFLDINQTKTGFIKSIDLKVNKKYHNNSALIHKLSFNFFEKKDDLVKAAKTGEINGFTLASFENNETETEKEIAKNWPQAERFASYAFSMPRYFAVFFNNQKSSIFSDENLREAFLHSVDKDEIIENISDGKKSNVSVVGSPILPEIFGYKQPSITYNFDIEKAKSLLDKSGFKQVNNSFREKAIEKKPAFQFKTYLKVGSKGTDVNQLQSCLARLEESFKNLLKGDVNGTYGKATENAVTEFQKKYLPQHNTTGEVGAATRQKLNELCIVQSPNSEPLKFTLTTINQPQLVNLANLLKNHWNGVGADVEVKAIGLSELKQIIKDRDYQALLYGEALGAEPDIYPFWHSSQKIDPGLNLSSYENKEVDKLLKEARETLDPNLKKEKYEKLQDIILEDAPALFLYNPAFIYWVEEDVKGIDTEKIIDPAKRFINVTNWYIKTKRVWK